MRTVASTAIRVGRATMLAIGVGVSLAFVLSAATVAIAAVPGDPLKLGQVNIINNATTTLQGSGLGGTLPSTVLRVKRDGATGGPALTVDNTSTSGAARGVDVNVPPGEMPINVSPKAGKSDLNVDKLDGEDRTDFLSASRIYNISSSKVNSSGKETVTFLAPEGLECDNGDVALDASANANDVNDDMNNITRSGVGSYQIAFQDNNPIGSKFTVGITCSDSTNPFRVQ
jgi:hypothetical protein